MFFFTTILAAVCTAGLAFSAPVERAYNINDFDILNYALTLEFLERAFYREGIAKFTRDDFVEAGFKDPFYANLKEVASDEETHVTLLSGAITAAGGNPVQEATYAFGIKDPKGFVALSSVLEGVGVSAYLGAAASIVDKTYLTVAGSILTVEARHSAYIRAALKQTPFPTPFDTPLDFNEVFSLAAQFITAPPKMGGTIPFKAFPSLKIQPSRYEFRAGSSLTFKDAFKDGGIEADKDVYAAFFSGLGTYFVKSRRTGNDYKIDDIPKEVKGQVYVVLTYSPDRATDETILKGPAIIEVGPQISK